MKREILLIILILVIGANHVAAQNKSGGGVAPAIFYNGLETSAGTIDPASGFQYGNTFVLTSTGEWDTRYLTISINHRAMFNGVGATGGSWSLTVFREGVYVGSVFGEVVSGDIQNIVNGSGKIIAKRTRLNLWSTGGTGVFEREKTFAATLELTTDLRSLETSGIGFQNL